MPRTVPAWQSVGMGGRRNLLLWPAALTALCAGCGGAATPPATGAPPVRTPADRVTGEVVAQQGGTVVLSSPDGSDRGVVVTHRTAVTRVVTADPADLTPGTCVAGGRGSATSAGIAAWVLIEGPAGCARPGAAIVGRPDPGISVVVGTVENVVGRDVTVRSPAGRDHFAYTVATPVGRVLDVPLADVIPGRCVVARGRRANSGQLTARHIHIVPTPQGGCFGAGGSGGVALLASVEPRPGTGGPLLAADQVTGGGGGGGGGGNGINSGGTIGGGGATPFPLPQDQEGSNLTPPSQPPRGAAAAPPEFVPPPTTPPPGTPVERTGGSTPGSGPGTGPRGPSPPPPGMRRGAAGSSPPPG